MRTLKIFAAILLLAPPALAETSVSVTQTTRAGYLGDNQNGREDDDDYALLTSRTDLRGTSGAFDTQVRLDGVLFASEDGVEGPARSQSSYGRLERLTVKWRGQGWTVEAGDHHLQLGRGIALSLKPVEAAGVDVALRGGQVTYRGERHELTVFGGLTNTANFDVLARKSKDDVDDQLAGARYVLRLPELPSLHVFGVYAKPEEALLPGEDDRATTLGAALDAPELWEVLSIYLEGDFQRRTLAGLEEDGKALYGTVDLSFKETQLLVEGLLLDAFEQKGSRNTALGNRFDYNRPPTLERVDQEVFDNRDVRGLRVRVERPVGMDELVGHLNGMYRVQKPDEPSEITQRHVYGGLELSLPEERVAVSGGFRDEQHEDGRAFKSMIHAEADATFGVGYGLDGHLAAQTEWRTLEGDEYERGSVFAGVDHPEYGGLTVEVGYDNQDERDGVRQLFVAGLASTRLGASSELKAAVGTQRGGIKCVGGVCRDYPAFAGGTLEWVGRF